VRTVVAAPAPLSRLTGGTKAGGMPPQGRRPDWLGPDLHEEIVLFDKAEASTVGVKKIDVAAVTHCANPGTTAAPGRLEPPSRDGLAFPCRTGRTRLAIVEGRRHVGRGGFADGE